MSSTQKGLARQPAKQSRNAHHRQRNAPIDGHQPQGGDPIPSGHPPGSRQLPRRCYCSQRRSAADGGGGDGIPWEWRTSAALLGWSARSKKGGRLGVALGSSFHPSHPPHYYPLRVVSPLLLSLFLALPSLPSPLLEAVRRSSVVDSDPSPSALLPLEGSDCYSYSPRLFSLTLAL